MVGVGVGVGVVAVTATIQADFVFANNKRSK